MSQARAEIEVLSAGSLTGEMVARIQDDPRALVCVAAIPPGGLAQTRYRCKRLRAAVPGRRILVGRWGGLSENSERIRGQLLDAYADRVATTLIESRNQFLPLIQFAITQSEQTAPTHATLEPLASR